MAGVASPMMRRTVNDGVRFLAGIATGTIMAALVLSIPIYVLGTASQLLLTPKDRTLVLVAACCVLAAADLTRHTPQFARQVPQQLFWQLRPGALGFVWGFDQGLLVTTQKATSLVWVALFAVTLLEPTFTPAFLMLLATAGWIPLALASLAPRLERYLVSRAADPWLAIVERGSGLTLLALGALTVLGVVP